MGNSLEKTNSLTWRYFAFVAIIVGITMAAFQNCGKSQQVSGDGSSDQFITKSTVDVNKVTIHMEPFINSPELITNVQYKQVHSIEVSLLNNTYRALDVNNNDLGPILQLTQAQSESMKDLFKEASVCKPIEKTLSPDTMCTMEFRLAYADLHDAKESMSLGQADNGCATPVDLCGDDASLLKSYLREVVEDYFHSTQDN